MTVCPRCCWGPPAHPGTQPLLPRRTRCSSTAFPPTQESAALSWKHTNYLTVNTQNLPSYPLVCNYQSGAGTSHRPCVSRAMEAGTAARVGRGKAVFAAGAAAAPQSPEPTATLHLRVLSNAQRHPASLKIHRNTIQNLETLPLHPVHRAGKAPYAFSKKKHKQRSKKNPTKPNLLQKQKKAQTKKNHC